MSLTNTFFVFENKSLSTNQTINYENNRSVSLLSTPFNDLTTVDQASLDRNAARARVQQLTVRMYI